MSYALIAAASSAARDRARAWPAEPVSDTSGKLSQARTHGVSPGHSNSNRTGNIVPSSRVAPRPSPRPSRLPARSTPTTPARGAQRAGTSDSTGTSQSTTLKSTPPAASTNCRHHRHLLQQQQQQQQEHALGSESGSGGSVSRSRRAASIPCVSSTNRALRSPGRGGVGAHARSSGTATPDSQSTPSAVVVPAPQVTVSLVGQGGGRLGYRGSSVAGGVAAQVVEAFAEHMTGEEGGRDGGKEGDGERQRTTTCDRGPKEGVGQTMAEPATSDHTQGRTSAVAASSAKAKLSSFDIAGQSWEDHRERSICKSASFSHGIGGLPRPTEPLEVVRSLHPSCLVPPHFSSTPDIGTGDCSSNFDEGVIGKDFTFALDDPGSAKRASNCDESLREDQQSNQCSAWQELESSLKEELLRDLLPEILAEVSKRQGELRQTLEANDEKLADGLLSKIGELNVKLGANMQALEDELTESIRHVAKLEEEAQKDQEAKMDEIRRENAGLIDFTKEAIGDLRRDVVDVLGQSQERGLASLQGDISRLRSSLGNLEANLEVMKLQTEEKLEFVSSEMASLEDRLNAKWHEATSAAQQGRDAEAEVVHDDDDAESLETLSERLEMLSARVEAVVGGEVCREQRCADLESMLQEMQERVSTIASTITPIVVGGTGSSSSQACSPHGQAGNLTESLFADHGVLERPASTRSGSTIPPVAEAFSPAALAGKQTLALVTDSTEADETDFAKRIEEELCKWRDSARQLESALDMLGEEVDHNRVGMRSCLDRLQAVEDFLASPDEGWLEEVVSQMVKKEVAATMETSRSHDLKPWEQRLAALEATVKDMLLHQEGQFQSCIERLETEHLDESSIRQAIADEWGSHLRQEIMDETESLLTRQLGRALELVENSSRVEEESRTRLDTLEKQLEEIQEELSQKERLKDALQKEEGEGSPSENLVAAIDDSHSSEDFLTEIANARGTADAAMTMVERRSEELADSMEATEVALRRDFKKDLLSLKEELETKFAEVGQKVHLELSSKKGQFLMNKAQLEQLESTLEDVRTSAAAELHTVVTELQGSIAEVQQECRGWVDTALQRLEDIAIRTRERLGEFSKQMGGLRESLGRELQSMLSALVGPLASRLDRLAAEQNRRRQMLSKAALAANVSSEAEQDEEGYEDMENEGGEEKNSSTSQDVVRQDTSHQPDDVEQYPAIRPAPPAKPQPLLRRVPSFTRITRQQPAQTMSGSGQSQHLANQAQTQAAHSADVAKVRLIPVTAGLLAACASDPTRPRAGTYSVPGSILPKRRAAPTGQSALLQREIDAEDADDDVDASNGDDDEEEHGGIAGLSEDYGSGSGGETTEEIEDETDCRPTIEEGNTSGCRDGLPFIESPFPLPAR